MKDLFLDAAHRATLYLESLGARAVAPSADAVRNLSELDIPLPVEPASDSYVLAQLDRLGSPATMPWRVHASSDLSSAERCL